VTCHVANCVAVCKEKGYTVPGTFKVFGKTWVDNLEKYLESLQTIKLNCDNDERDCVIAYSFVSNLEFSLVISKLVCEIQIEKDQESERRS
jgi:hypothetical protein